jgi:hypothetical protein
LFLISKKSKEYDTFLFNTLKGVTLKARPTGDTSTINVRRGGAEPHHTIGPAFAAHLAGQPQQVQVRHGFAQSKGGLVHIQGAFEQRGQELVGTARLRAASLQQLGQALCVV